VTARYGQLINIIDDVKPKTILEVGTWNGDRAIQMAEAALKHQEQVTYYGFDLFEEASDETDAAELNVKRHFTVDEVITKLKAFQEKVGVDRFQAHLFKGNTRETLLTVMAPEHGVEIDFAFIDGGHSIEVAWS
jgi:predicted O-methyltransferase YrrM